MKLVQVIRSEMQYSARSWDTEVAHRYVLQSPRGPLIEASHFTHLKAGKWVKDVVELASSFGCPVGCRHCAASLINRPMPLTAQELAASAEVVLREHQSADLRLITYSGIGEGSLAAAAVAESATALQARYRDARFVLTTSGVLPEYISSVGALARDVRIKFLQVSLLADTDELFHRLVPLADKLGTRLDDVATALETTSGIRYRLNYVVIADTNDSPERFLAALDRFGAVKDRAVLRISRLNETDMSRLEGLRQPTKKAVDGLTSLAQFEGWDAYSFYSSSDDGLNCGQLSGDYMRRFTPLDVGAEQPQPRE